MCHCRDYPVHLRSSLVQTSSRDNPAACGSGVGECRIHHPSASGWLRTRCTSAVHCRHCRHWSLVLCVSSEQYEEAVLVHGASSVWIRTEDEDTGHVLDATVTNIARICWGLTRIERRQRLRQPRVTDKADTVRIRHSAHLRDSRHSRAKCDNWLLASRRHYRCKNSERFPKKREKNPAAKVIVFDLCTHNDNNNKLNIVCYAHTD